MSEQHNTQKTTLYRPPNEDKKAWKVYWREQDQTWRTEPEIDTKRQKYLIEQRSVKPDIEGGIYPFKDIEPKLTRADVEWLLATHENGQGPIDWSDESHRRRIGLDLRGANLSKLDLSGLPLSLIQGGLTGREFFYASPEQCRMAAVQMEETLLIGTSLEGIKLNEAQLRGANLYRANLEGAEFKGAFLEKAFLNEAYLGGASFSSAHLEGADLRRAHLEGKSTQPADFRRAFFDTATVLNDICIGNKEHGVITVADVRWNGVNLSVVQWSEVKMLGDEYRARQKWLDGYEKDKNTRIKEHEAAVRANRQLVVALQGQGMNEVAARFAYRAQMLQRKVFWFQGKFGQYLFSLFLDLLTGYGYKLERSIFAYLLVIGVFAALYYHLGAHLAWNEAIVISMTAFHGRGFFPEQFHPGDPQALIAAIEAFVGLLVEVTLIATLTQRLFGK